MASLNISFEIPQSPTFSVDEFSRMVKNYANSLIERMSQSADKPRVLKYEELDPVIKELCGVCKVPEWDMNGDFAKEEFLAEKYGKEHDKHFRFSNIAVMDCETFINSL